VPLVSTLRTHVSHETPSSRVREIDSYLVRIVRRDGEALVGVVEQVRTGKTAAFATLAELSELLGGQRRFTRLRSPVASDDNSPEPTKQESKP
jgi:hypothetical protein